MATRSRRLRVGAVGGVLALALTACAGDEPAADSPSSAATPEGGSTTSTSASVSDVEVVATNLDVPWDIEFLPGGDALVTLRDRGEVVRVNDSGTTSLGPVPGSVPGGEGGLLGLAVSPTFEEDRTVFVYTTTDEDNRVLRMTLEGGELSGAEPILTGIPTSSIHNGGRMAFGPEDHLFVTTGDAGDGSNAQDPESLGGKILRITPEGEPAPGNPDPDSPVWTSGHRNVQGIAWRDDGTMWASEFGQNTWDELNKITKGSNYGWPEVEGEGSGDEYTDPVAQWTPAEASPSGIAVDDEGAIVMAGLRGQSLWRIPVTGSGEDTEVGTPKRMLHEEYGRLRAVEPAPDGGLWVLTNNTFRGDPAEDDDKILRVRL